MLVNGAPWPVLDVAARKVPLPHRERLERDAAAPCAQHAPAARSDCDRPGTASVDRPCCRRSDWHLAERIEVVVDFSLYPIGSQVVLENRRADGPRVASCVSTSFAPRGTTASSPSGSPNSSRCSDRRPSHAHVRVRWNADAGGPPGVRWVSTAKSFDPLRVDADPRLDDVEVWRFVNRGFMGRTMLHPVHTHLAPFQVLRRNGSAPLRQEARMEGHRADRRRRRGRRHHALERLPGPLSAPLPQPRARGPQHDGSRRRGLTRTTQQ